MHLSRKFNEGFSKRCFYASIYLVLVVGLFEFATGNVGREFIVTLPDARWTTTPDSLHAEIIVSLDTTKEPQIQGGVTTVNVFMKLPPRGNAIPLTKVNPYQILVIHNRRQFPKGNARGQQYVVHLVSDGDITVEVQNGDRTNFDMYLCLPITLLGTTYYALTPASKHSENCFLVIASTEESTRVKVTLPEFLPVENTIVYNSVTYRGGDTIDLSLLPLEGVQLQSDNVDLTGFKVESDHPVAVWSGADRAYLVAHSGGSHLSIQTPSTKMAGRRFVYLPVPLLAPLLEMRIVAAQSWPIVTVHFYNGTSSVYHMSRKGSLCELQLDWASDKSVLVESSKDVLVYRITSQGFTSPMVGGQIMAALSPVDKTLPASITFVTRVHIADHIQIYLSIVIKSSDKDSLTINGESFHASHDVTAHDSYAVRNSDLVVEVIRLTEPTFADSGYALVESSSDVGFTGILDVMKKGDAECRILSYPDVPNVITSDESYEEDISECCVDISRDGISVTTLYNDLCYDFILDAPDPCCLTDFERVTCRPIKRVYACEFQGYALTTSSVHLVSASSILECFRSCMMWTECVGANIDINSIHGNDNCQLLSGYRFERRPIFPWRHIECKVTIYYEI